MVEKGFVDALMKTIKGFHEGVAYRPSDNRTMGMPDVMGYIPIDQDKIDGRRLSTIPTTWAIAIEAKALRPLMDDPFHRGRRTGKMLKHPFSGPQISALRDLKKACVDAFGLVRVSTDGAFRIEPEDLDARTGNFTHEELVKIGRYVIRERGIWKFWESHMDEAIRPTPAASPK